MSQASIPTNIASLLEADGITLANTLGAMFICFTLTIFLFGLLSYQVHLYYANQTDARPAIKNLVSPNHHFFKTIFNSDYCQVAFVWYFFLTSEKIAAL